MADHADPAEQPVTSTEPAVVTEITRLIVAALVALGVFQFDDATWDTITLIVGGLISIGLSWWTRRKVTPTAKPKTDDGVPLVPAPPVPPPDAGGSVIGP